MPNNKKTYDSYLDTHVTWHVTEQEHIVIMCVRAFWSWNFQSQTYILNRSVHMLFISKMDVYFLVFSMNDIECETLINFLKQSTERGLIFNTGPYGG